MNVSVENKINKPLVCLRARTHAGATISVQIGKVQRADLTCDVIKKLAPFV